MMTKTNFSNSNKIEKYFSGAIEQKLSPDSVRFALDNTLMELPHIGFPLRLYSEQSLQKFAFLPPETRSQIIESLKFRLIVLSEIEIQAPGLESRLVRHAFDKMHLKCESNFLEKIKSHDIVEIYSLKNIQAFANFEFFRNSTYSLLDLSVMTWDELFSRNTLVTAELHGKISKMMTSGNSIEEYSVRPHVVKEKISLNRKSFLIFMGQMAPVYSSSGERFGMIHTLRVNEIKAGATTSLVLDN
mgnify:CR=1 FL=1